jgi:hypothetical protein
MVAFFLGFCRKSSDSCGVSKVVNDSDEAFVFIVSNECSLKEYY